MSIEILVRIRGRDSIEVQRVDSCVEQLTPKVRYEVLQEIEKQLENVALMQGQCSGSLDERLAR